MAAATIRSFSARDQRRRRCTDVITSTCVLVIVLALVIVLGLDAKTHLRKAALTGCVHAKDRARSNSGVQSVLVKERFRPADLVERIRPLVHKKPEVISGMEAAS